MTSRDFECDDPWPLFQGSRGRTYRGESDRQLSHPSSILEFGLFRSTWLTISYETFYWFVLYYVTDTSKVYSRMILSNTLSLKINQMVSNGEFAGSCTHNGFVSSVICSSGCKSLRKMAIQINLWISWVLIIGCNPLWSSCFSRSAHVKNILMQFLPCIVLQLSRARSHPCQ